MTSSQYQTVIRSLPRMIRELTESNTTFSVYVGVLVLCIFLVSRSGRLPAIMVSTFLGPTLAAITLILKPLNPYENLYAKKQGISARDIKENRSALLLIDILKSPAAMQYTIVVAAVLSVLLSVLGFCFWALQHKSGWAFDLSRDIVGLVLTGPLSFAVESILLLRWAMHRLSQSNGYGG